MDPTLQHFIVLSHQRAGSHYLMNLLNSHPEVHCRSDFQSADVLREGPQWALAEGFAPAPPATRVGFLAKFKNQLHHHLAPNVKVVLLERKNLLAQLLSKRRSSKFGCYDTSSTSLQDAVRLREQAPPEFLEPEVCAGYFQRTVEAVSEARQALAGRLGVIEVTYEQLCDDREQTVRRIWRELEVADHYPVSATQGRGGQKLEQRPLRDSIANYDQLRDAFAGGPWEPLFDEQFQNG